MQELLHFLHKLGQSIHWLLLKNLPLGHNEHFRVEDFEVFI